MTGRIYDRTIEACIYALLALTPFIGLGSVHTWVYRLEAALAFALLSLWLLKAARRKGFSYPRTPFVFFLPVTAAFVAFQSVPLPVSAVHAISPGMAVLDAAAGFRAGSESLSVYPWAALDKGLLVASLVVFFLLVLGHPWKREGATRIVYIVTGVGTLLATLALFRSGDPNVERHFWPYVNKNHFAGYIEVAISLAVAAIVYNIPGGERERRVRGVFAKLMSGGWLDARTLLAACVCLMFTGLLLSVSRGGLIGLAAGLLVIAATGFGGRRRAAAAAVTAMLLAVLGLSLVDTGRFAARIRRLADVTEDKSAMLRLDIWKDTAGIIKDFPLTGVGLGGFETAYQHYKTVSKYTIIFQPENDYLYTLAEGGLLGFLIAGAFAALVVAGLLRARKDADDARVSGLLAGVLAALAALFVHGFVDTNLHIPANAFLVAVLAAAGLSLGIGRDGDGGRPSGRDGFVTVSLRGWASRGAVYLCACLLLLPAGYAAAGAFADRNFKTAMVEKEFLAGLSSDDPGHYVAGYEDILGHMEMSDSLDQGRIDYPFEKGSAYNALGRLVEKLGSEKADDLGLLLSSEYYGLAYEEFKAAQATNPYNSFAHLLAGRALEDGLGDWAAGEAEYLTAERLNPTNRLIKQVLIAFYRKSGDKAEADRRNVALAKYDADNNPVKIVSLTPDTADNTAYVGDRVRWTAVAEVVAGTLEYKFCLRNRDYGDLVEMTEFTPSAEWVWDTSSSEPGRYRVVVRVRGAGGMARERSMAYEGGMVLKKR